MTGTPCPQAEAPALYRCTVKHTRSSPKRHAFTYRTYQWFVDLDHLPRLRWPLSLLSGFRSRDHFGDQKLSAQKLRDQKPGEVNRGIRENVDAFLTDRGIDLNGGRVLMLTQARVLGYVFNPLTVYWCHYGSNHRGNGHHRDGELACVIAEVHNTYGQRHCYLLRTDDQGLARTPKEFYVSPFFQVRGEYRMALPLPDQGLALSIALLVGTETVFVATLRGDRRPATAAQLCHAALRHGWSTALVSLRIRIQGVKLWLRGLPIQHRPPHPAQSPSPLQPAQSPQTAQSPQQGVQ
ncbi:MAG: DUF1365 domain-containing protein [Mycobacteriales bacterium]